MLLNLLINFLRTLRELVFWIELSQPLDIDAPEHKIIFKDGPPMTRSLRPPFPRSEAEAKMQEL